MTIRVVKKEYLVIVFLFHVNISHYLFIHIMFYLFQLSKIQASIKSKDFKQHGDSIEEGVSYTFRDILCVSNLESEFMPLGGKVVVLGGDFRQILPVIPRGPKHDVVDASINSLRLWKYCRVLKLTKNMRLQTGSSSSDVNELKEFSNWILNVGDGNIGENNDGEAEIEILNDMLIKN